MKYFLVCLALLLTACGSYADPYAQRAAADEAIRATQRAVAQEQQAQLEEKRQAEIAVMETQGAASVEIDLMSASNLATQTAISNAQAQLDQAIVAGQATRAASDYSLQATMTVQAAQATSTAVALVMAGEAARVQREQAAATFWTNFLPVLITVIVMALSVFLTLAIGLWFWRAKKRAEMDLELQNRQNMAKVTPYGLLVWSDHGGEYLEAELIDKPIREIQFDTGKNELPVVDGDAEEEVIKDTPQALAGKLIIKSAAEHGWESHDLLGYRDAEMSGRKWSLAIQHLQNIIQIDTHSGDGTRAHVTLKQALYANNTSLPQV